MGTIIYKLQLLPITPKQVINEIQNHIYSSLFPFGVSYFSYFSLASIILLTLWTYFALFLYNIL